MSDASRARLSGLLATLAAYDAVRRLDGSLPTLSLVAIKVTPSSPLSTAAAWQNANARGGEGWVRHRSLVRLTTEPAPELGDPEAGPPLVGEWALDKGGMSVHLRAHPDKPGMLQEFVYEERALEATESLDVWEEPALCQEIAVRANAPISKFASGADAPTISNKQLMLIYRVFWGAGEDEEPSALRRLCARFNGWCVIDAFAGEPVVVRPRTRA